jgi:hypothetical protein
VGADSVASGGTEQLFARRRVARECQMDDTAPKAKELRKQTAELAHTVDKIRHSTTELAEAADRRSILATGHLSHPSVPTQLGCGRRLPRLQVR